MTTEQENLFNKYVVEYETGDQLNRIDYQRKVYNTLIEKGSENTGVEKLFEMTNDEIEKQYIRKEHFENRAGFLLALWGIAFSVVLNKNMLITISILKNNVKYSVMDIIFLILILLFGVMSLYFICNCLTAKNIYHFQFGERENNFVCACEDKSLFMVVALMGLSDVWEMNEEVIQNKGNNFNKAIYSLVAYMVTILLAYLC